MEADYVPFIPTVKDAKAAVQSIADLNVRSRRRAW